MARTTATDGERIDPNWGAPYGDASYLTPDGPVWLHRKGCRCRFFDADGNQVGPEQANVYPAVVYAAYHNWQDTLASPLCNALAHAQTVATTTLPAH